MKKITLNNKSFFVACACGGLPNHEHKDSQGNWILDCKCGCHEKGHDLNKEWFSDMHGKWFKHDERSVFSEAL